MDNATSNLSSGPPLYHPCATELGLMKIMAAGYSCLAQPRCGAGAHSSLKIKAGVIGGLADPLHEGDDSKGGKVV
jgi:hypothetical protein